MGSCSGVNHTLKFKVSGIIRICFSLSWYLFLCLAFPQCCGLTDAYHYELVALSD